MADQDEQRLAVRFYTEPFHMKAKSEKEGRPVYEDREMISILVPGDTRTEVVRFATDEDRERFPKVYEAFKKNAELAETGTPLEEFSPLTKSRVQEMKALHIRTVEQLANLQENAIQKLGPGTREEVAKAQGYLAQSGDKAGVEQIAAENERLKVENKRLNDQLADTGKQLKALQDEKAAKK